MTSDSELGDPPDFDDMSVDEKIRHVDDLRGRIASGPDQVGSDSDCASVDERIRHAQDFWDRVAANPDQIELTEAQKKELDRRLQDLHDNPDVGIPWKEVRKRLEQEQ